MQMASSIAQADVDGLENALASVNLSSDDPIPTPPMLSPPTTTNLLNGLMSPTFAQSPSAMCSPPAPRVTTPFLEPSYKTPTIGNGRPLFSPIAGTPALSSPLATNTPYLVPSYARKDHSQLSPQDAQIAALELKSPPVLSPPPSLQLFSAPGSVATESPPLAVGSQLVNSFPSPLSTVRSTQAPTPLSPVPTNIPAAITPGRSIGISIANSPQLPPEKKERKAPSTPSAASSSLKTNATNYLAAAFNPQSTSLYDRFFTTSEKENTGEELHITSEMSNIYRSTYPDVTIPNVSLTTFLLKALETTGQRPRIIDSISGNSFTGPQLARYVRQFAYGLHVNGLNQGDVVAVISPNTIWYPVIVFGSIAAYGIVTTLNPTYTPDEVAYQLKDAGATLLFYSPVLEANVKAAIKSVPSLRRVIAIGSPEFEALVNSPDGVLPVRQVRPSRDLCLLPYSSGTTGLAKGVMLSHRNVISNIVQVSDMNNAAGGMTETDVVSAVLPMYHIYGLSVILCTALYRGATLIVFPKFDLEQFLAAVQHHRMTRLFIVPPIVLALAKHPLVNKYDLSSVKLINSGAAPLGEELATQCAQRLKCSVVQGYGMTELAPVSHMPPPNAPDRPATVGVLVPSMEARIVDAESGKDAARGQAGELWLRGPNVMLGYWRNDEATRITIDQDGWLKTGDVAVIDKDGYYMIVDRVKELIKFKGLQVAPAELEALLLAHPKIADAAVVPYPDVEAGELPKAFIVKRDDKLTADEVMEFIKSRVAYHKRVRLVEFIDVIPKAPSGKILRRFLRDKDRAAAAAANKPAAKL